ncbi:MAG: LEA type 2 family protein [Nitrosopumilus sp.]|nr:LEA type 2 family protein [Nitrosopumilus sp.]
MKKTIIIIVSIVIAIVAIILGLTAYSYTQVHVSFSNVSSVDIELENLSWPSLIKLGLEVLSGDWISAALNVIAGINLGLVFELSNNGLLPVYIPELSYELSINGIPIGTGSSEINTSINPGGTKEIEILQNFQKDSFSPAIESVVDTEGVMDIGVSGTAYFELLGQSIPVPFESSRQISIVDEIQNQLNQQIQN